MHITKSSPNVFDGASTLYECYTNVLCLLDNPLDTRGLLTLSILQDIIQLIVILRFVCAYIKK